VPSAHEAARRAMKRFAAKPQSMKRSLTASFTIFCPFKKTKRSEAELLHIGAVSSFAKAAGGQGEAGKRGR